MTFDAVQPGDGPIRGEHHVRATPERRPSANAITFLVTR